MNRIAEVAIHRILLSKKGNQNNQKIKTSSPFGVVNFMKITDSAFKCTELIFGFMEFCCCSQKLSENLSKARTSTLSTDYLHQHISICGFW